MGAKGTLEMDVMPQIKVEQEDSNIIVTRVREHKGSSRGLTV
jgi:hypothetical protein